MIMKNIQIFKRFTYIGLSLSALIFFQEGQVFGMQEDREDQRTGRPRRKGPSDYPKTHNFIANKYGFTDHIIMPHARTTQNPGLVESAEEFKELAGELLEKKRKERPQNHDDYQRQRKYPKHEEKSSLLEWLWNMGETISQSFEESKDDTNDPEKELTSLTNRTINHLTEFVEDTKGGKVVKEILKDWNNTLLK